MSRKNRSTSRKHTRQASSLRVWLEAAPQLSGPEWRRGLRDKRGGALPAAPVKRWQLQEAKARFSALFDRALDEGPQVVTRHNKQAVVVLSADEYRKLAGAPRHPQVGLLKVLLQCPKGADLSMDRDENSSVLKLPPVFH